MRTLVGNMFKKAIVFIVLSQLVLVGLPPLKANAVAAQVPAPVLDSYNINPDDGVSTSATPVLWVHAVDPSGYQITTCQYRYMTSQSAWTSWKSGIYYPDQTGPDANGVMTDLVGTGSCQSADFTTPLTSPDFTGQLRVANSKNIYATTTTISRKINRVVPKVTVQNVYTENNPLPVVGGTIDDPNANIWFSIHNADNSVFFSYPDFDANGNMIKSVVNHGNGTWSAAIVDALPRGTYTVDVSADNMVNTGYATGTYEVGPPIVVNGITNVTSYGVPTTVANNAVANFSYTIDNSTGYAYSSVGYFVQIYGTHLNELKTLNYVDGSNVVDLLPYFNEWGWGSNSYIEGIGLPIDSTGVLNTGDVLTKHFQIAFNNPTPAVSKQYSMFFGVMSGPMTFVSNSDAVFTVDPAVVTADTIAPNITVNGQNPMNIVVGSTYTDAGATAVDNVDPSVAVVTTGSVNTAVVGSYTITYTATDAAGNVATATRTVNVIAAPVLDTVAPVITLKGANPDQVTVGTSYVDPGATALDAVDGSVAVVATGTVNTAVVGPNTITYTAKDAAGNTATATRTVNVVAAPVVLMGDANHDGVVDLIDLAIIGANWGMTGTNIADVNNDGVVDLIDLAIVGANWTVV